MSVTGSQTNLSQSITESTASGKYLQPLNKLFTLLFAIYYRSGTSSHTQTIAKYVRYYVDVQATELGNFPPVESAAAIMRQIIYSNAGSLSASMICSGWDPYKGYQIYSVN